MLSPQDWKSYFEKLIKKESIETFSIVGYSMGGRFALTTFKHFSHKIEHLYLVAPDGLVSGNWYKFATGSHVQRLLFKSVLNSYSTFLAFAKSLSKIGMLNKGLLKFSSMHLQNKEERNRVYNTWTSFRLLNLSPIELDSISKKHKISIDLILGNYDRVIPIKRIEPQLLKSSYLNVKKVSITHNKLFYYNFLERA